MEERMYPEREYKGLFHYLHNFHHVFPHELVPEFGIVRAHSNSRDHRDAVNLRMLGADDLFCFRHEALPEAHVLSRSV